ncbi:unnamed protein product, partial [Clonostachys chloroleuca]
TEGTVLGHFHTHEAEHVNAGSLISYRPDCEPLFVLYSLNNTDGKPISSRGPKPIYRRSTQRGFTTTSPDGRGVLTSVETGNFVSRLLSRYHTLFRTIGPILYVKDNPYKSADAVLSVKGSPVFLIKKAEDEDLANQYGVKLGSALPTYDFVLITDRAAAKLH